MRAFRSGAALHSLALAAMLAAAVPAATRALEPAGGLRGTYRLQGRARLDASPFPATDEEVHADAVLSPGSRPGELRIHLAAQGFACELAATVDAAGALALPQGQRCNVDLRSDRTDGRVDARLVSGRGRADGEVLELELAFALSGSVRLRGGGSLEALGQILSLPGTSRDPLPVRGEASGRAAGQRDRSRAGQ
jgi:hypothetical protein